MRWERGRRSGNIEDRRGRSVRGAAGLGKGGLVVVLLLMAFAWISGRNPLEVLQLLDTGTSGPAGPVETGVPPADDPQAQFVATVLADTEDTWSRVFADGGGTYEPPVLVLFTGAVASACGRASAAVGPFYCPADRKVYLDLSFFRQLDEQFGAPGDFAQAYVVAHEVGHHVQTLLGVSEQVAALGRGGDEAAVNALSVRQELQADCFAGLWAYYAGDRRLLEPGDVDEGLAAAAAIGDDRLQREASGQVRPETFTHGTSEERVRWLRQGLDSGSLDACDTFNQ